MYINYGEEILRIKSNIAKIKVWLDTAMGWGFIGFLLGYFGIFLNILLGGIFLSFMIIESIYSSFEVLLLGNGLMFNLRSGVFFGFLAYITKRLNNSLYYKYLKILFWTLYLIFHIFWYLIIFVARGNY